MPLQDNDNKSVTTLSRSVMRLSRLEDVDEVFANLSRMLRRMVKSRWVVVYLLDREAHDFAPGRCYGLRPDWEKLFSSLPLLPEKQLLLRRLLARKRQLPIENPANSELFPPFFQHLLRSFTLLVLPLQVRQQLLGVVFVARPRRLSHFTPAEIASVRELVSQAALVASHIRLYDESFDMALEMAKRIDMILMLDDINKAISSSLDHDRIITIATDRLDTLIQCDLQAVAGLRRGKLVMMSGRCNSMALPPCLAPGSLLKREGLIRRALATGKIQYSPDITQSSGTHYLLKTLAECAITSLLVIPLLVQAEARGVLLLGDRAPGHFRSEEAFVIEKIAAQLAVALENSRLYDDMRQLFFSTVASLANAIDAKSPWTKGHSERVMHVAANIAKTMGLDDEAVERVRLGGLLHDIGKIGIMEALLEKPAELDEYEFPPIRLHPEKGVAILAPIEQLKAVLPGILHHHEFFDGSGYPYGLAGEAIPLDARIIAVADSFDAMVADRPYRKGLGIAAAAAELVRCSGSQFDPEVVDCFCARLAAVVKDTSLYPTGRPVGKRQEKRTSAAETR
jgi:HD-GYP domain-containing protein (c-di-GMP phosphodiesterase class II)